MCKDCGCSITDHGHTHEHHHHGDHEHPELNNPKTVEVITKILSENDKEATANRAHFDTHNILAINLMSSPGSGKTALLEKTIEMADDLKLGVIEGDLETNNDADRIAAKGAPAYQITTGQACHLDAFMVHKGIHHMPLENLDICFVENVGNLVCPASYDIGTHLNVVLLSVPEGDDKPAKYPVMFKSADLFLITKTDLKEHFDFSIERATCYARELNPKVDVIEISIKSGEGMQQWIDYLKMKKSLR